MPEKRADVNGRSLGEAALDGEDARAGADHKAFDCEQVLTFELSGRGGAGVDPLEQLVEIFGRRDRDRARPGDGAFGHTGEHSAGPEFGEVVDTRRRQRVQHVLPTNGARELRREEARPLVALVVGQPVDVGDDRNVGVAGLGGTDRVAQPVAGGRHERRVEGPRDGKGHHPLGAEFLRVLGGRGDAVGRAGDDHLTGSVEVGDPHFGVGSAACDLYMVVVESEHGGHRARLGEACIVHRRRPSRDETDAVVETERTGRRQRGVLTEAVAGAVARFDAQALGCVEHDQARHERGELGIARVLQFVGVGIAQQAGDIALGDLARLADEFPTLVIEPGPTHPGPL